ncbi:DNA internalization-related competence protein ComEC/Rec2 [Acinetobacter rongchengensis]|nr:DNA internalization-related competence protein ComEC/Rec2 [Acinetobacter rongchengensis]
MSMYSYIILIGWILGISFMGVKTPQSLNLYFALSLGLSLILLGFKYFNRFYKKYSCTDSSIFKCMTLITVCIFTYLSGLLYADHALEKRLALRPLQNNQSQHLIYIQSMNKIKLNDQAQNNTPSFRQQKLIQQRIVVLMPNQQPIPMVMYVNEQQAEMIQLGHYYQVTGQFKVVHGYAVEGTFDKEKWFLQENLLGILDLQAIHTIDENQLKQFGFQSFIDQQQHFDQRILLKIERLRLDFRHFISNSSLHNKGLLLALLTGDESLLSVEIQSLFKKLGIAHLLAISGPHVLIFAMMFCFIFNLIARKIYPKIFLKIPRLYLLVYPFLACVVFYTAFVGFEIPALRTMIMVSVFSLILLLNQKIQAIKHLLFTASILLLIDPFSILSAAFWLSFGACFILIRVYQTIQQQPRQQVQSWQAKLKHFVQVLFDSQWKTFIALMPLVLWIFQQFSWLTPLSNFIAIPVIGSLVVPIEVLAACMSLFSTSLGILLFKVADQLLSFLLSLLDFLDQTLGFKLDWWAFSAVQILCIAFAIFILFLPKGVIPRFWALICLIPLLLPNKSQYIFQFNVLDVGQGQAVFINLPEHKMMVDTGGFYDETKFSIGQNLIIPYLARQGVAQLDQVILSHLDQDHSGAFAEIAKVVDIQKVYSNEKDQRFDHSNFEYCYQGQHWQYGQVKIKVLSPPKNSLSGVPYNQNELSCVIYIQVPQSNQYQNFLIMGDAGWETEFSLLQQYPDLNVDVLVMGHHGSRHSSSFAFLKQLKPKLAIVSAGYGNRYGHPHPIVLKRLKALNIPVRTTIEQGSIEFNVKTNGQMEIKDFRQTQKWLIFKSHLISD